MCCSTFSGRPGLLAGLILICSSGCYNMNGYMLNASGQGFYQQGNYAMAAQQFQTALASNPANPDYMSNLAKARLKMGDQAGAEQLFRAALASSPSHQPSYHGLAEMMLAQGRSTDAQQLLSSWASTQPYVPESHVELAWLQRELGQDQLAEQTLKSALEVNPNHSTALAQLGQLYQDNGQVSEAVTLYQQSLRSNWNQPEVQSRLAVAAAAAGPNHPMSEMAMSRGALPYDMGPTQVAMTAPPVFGPQGMQMAAYPQMPVSPPQQVAWQQPSAPMMQQAAFPGMIGIPRQQQMAMLPHTAQMPPAFPQTASGPVPDPMFSQPNTVGPATASQPPMTSVSSSRIVAPAGPPQMPEIDAF
ncbi:MAG: tetratricopeptide repeat protein [Planctomycetaceae bacterium]